MCACSCRRNLLGASELIRLFSWPGGFPSHVNAETPGSIHEGECTVRTAHPTNALFRTQPTHLPSPLLTPFSGGELGYALAVAYGAVMDQPDLIVPCLVGDGEAETGVYIKICVVVFAASTLCSSSAPLDTGDVILLHPVGCLSPPLSSLTPVRKLETGPTAAAWHSTKFIDPGQDGAVLPIVHLNGCVFSLPLCVYVHKYEYGCMNACVVSFQGDPCMCVLAFLCMIVNFRACWVGIVVPLPRKG